MEMEGKMDAKEMSITPKISIVIPIYNVSKYIEDCLCSVINQSYKDYEVICVNDGSTDDSAVIVESLIQKEGLEGRVRLINQANAGLSAARNTGIETAKGEYILLLDSDDWLENNALERLALHLNGEDMVCFSGRRYFEDANKYEEPDILQEQTYESGWEYYCNNALKSRQFVFVCAVLRAYKREFLLNNKLWFTRGIFHEDNMFTPYACLYAGKTKEINESLYVYRIRKGSITTQPKLKNYTDKLWIANEQANFFAQQATIDTTVVYRTITHLYQNVFDAIQPNNYDLIRDKIDWKAYYRVSRTKLRHKVYFMAMYISPKLYHWIRKIV